VTEGKPKKPQRMRRAGRTTGNDRPRNPQGGGNVVFVGSKPIMNYMLACITHFNSGQNKIVVKAR
jgi:hypothetical protein